MKKIADNTKIVRVMYIKSNISYNNIFVRYNTDLELILLQIYPCLFYKSNVRMLFYVLLVSYFGSVGIKKRRYISPLLMLEI